MADDGPTLDRGVADAPFMTHKLIAALDAANALLNKDRT